MKELMTLLKHFFVIQNSKYKLGLHMLFKITLILQR